MTPQPRVLAIVVNWNKKDFLATVLERLQTLGGPPLDVAVVDNASSDGSPQMVRERFPNVNLLETGANLGGTGGFNFGMAWALNQEPAYDFLWLLDNDVLIHPGALEGLLAPMERDPKVGLVGSTILELENHSQVQEIGGRLNWRTCGLEKQGEGRLEETSRPQLIDVDYAAACSLMARTEAIRQVGTWDPCYFVTWDDVEWGIRFKRAGWRVVATTESIVEHESFDNRRARAGALIKYLSQRNCLYFVWRFAPAAVRPGLLFRQFRLALTAADHAEANGLPHEALAFRRAAADFLAARMGPAPAEVAKPPAAPPPPEPVQNTAPPNPKSLALLFFDNPDTIVKLHAELQRRFPDATIDVLRFSKQDSAKRVDLPRMSDLSLETFPRRLRVVWLVLTRYDAVAATSFAHRFLFETVARTSLRFTDTMEMRVEHRQLGRAAGLLLKRLLTLGKALACTVRALLKPRRPVDYFGFRKPT